MTDKTPFMERRDAERVYFLSGPGSQWYPLVFRQALRPGGPDYAFVCREQYMMACKAEAFEDWGSLDRILRAVPRDRDAEAWKALSTDAIQGMVPALMAPVSAALARDPARALKAFGKYPGAHKELGRGVAGYDDATWASMREDVVLAGSIAAAAQCPEFRAWLLGTVGRELVEGSGKDKIWGVGLWWDDDRILDKANWRGLNLLGKANGLARDWAVRNDAFLPSLAGARA